MRLTLETERLTLRPFELSDAPEVFDSWANDPEVTKYLSWDAHKSVEKTKETVAMWVEQYEKPERLNFAIVHKESGKLIGIIEVCGYLGGVDGIPVLACASSRAFWNHGYMTEATKCLLDYLFSQGYSEVRIDALTDNVGSNKVIKKCGGIFIKTEEDFFPLKNKNVLINRYVVKAN